MEAILGLLFAFATQNCEWVFYSAMGIYLFTDWLG